MKTDIHPSRNLRSKYPGPILTLILALLTISTVSAKSLSNPASEGTAVYFIGLQEGQAVTSPFIIQFGLSGMGVAPAGQDVAKTGHHHLLIDLEELPDMTLPLPKSAQVIHFGGGQTQTELELTPGSHTLQLLVGNYLHIPHDPPVISEKITVVVE